MSTAYKCDRCGVLYETGGQYHSDVGDNLQIGIRIRCKDTDTSADLCSICWWTALKSVVDRRPKPKEGTSMAQDSKEVKDDLQGIPRRRRLRRVRTG